MALIQTVHLSMANFKSAPVVPAVQNDSDRQVKMIIDDYTLTSGLTGKIAFERSDGTHYETAAELVLADNAFTADIDQALTQPGRTMVQLKVTDTLTVSSFSFVIFVEADNSGTVTPQEGIDLVTAVEAAEAAADRAESAAETLELDATLTSATKAAQAKAVGDAFQKIKDVLNSEDGFSTLTMTDYTALGYNLENNDVWGASTNYKCVLIPVEDLGDKVKFVSRTYKCSYAFLKSDTIVVGQAPDLCTGESIETVSVGGMRIDEVPSDCEYMYMYIAQNQYVNFDVYAHPYIATLNELKTDVDSIVVDALGSYITKEYKNYEVLTGYYTSDAGNLTSDANYNTYVYKADRDIEIYFKNEVQTSLYISLVGYSTDTYDSSHRLFTRKRYNGVDANTLPQENSKQKFLAGQYLAISIPTTGDFELYGYEYVVKLNNGIKFNDSQTDKIVELAQAEAGKSFVQYAEETTIESSSEQLSIFVPSGNNFIKYRFVHTEYADRNADVWRIGIADAVDSNFSKIVQLTSGAEWECALKIDGRADFSGGYAHGDEIGTELLVFVDGAEVDPTDIIDLTAFDELRLVTYSTLYDPADGTTVIAYHGCERIFAHGELKINQTIEWAHNETLSSCYLAMFGPCKVSDNIVITSDYYTDASYKSSSIPNPVARTIDGVNEAVLYSDASGFSGSVRLVKYPSGSGLTGNGSAIISDNSGNNYNKLYFVVCTGATITSGDVWKSSAVYKLDYPVSQ